MAIFIASITLTSKYRISQIQLGLPRFSRVCGSYHDFFYRTVLPTRKLLNKGFLVVKLKSSLRKCYRRHNDLVNRNMCVTNDHRCVPFVGITSWSFSYSWLITVFAIRVTWWVPHVEKELLTLPEHLGSFPVISGVCVARSFFLCIVL